MAKSFGKQKRNENDVLQNVQPSEDLLNHYKAKCNLYRQNYQVLVERLEWLEKEMKNRSEAEQRHQENERVVELQKTLGDTEALLVVERQQSQQLALHIDLLQQQCQAYREKIDLLLSLNGHPGSVMKLLEENSVERDVEKFRTLLNEQASLMLEERAILKKEWEREKKKFAKERAGLLERAASLEEQLLSSARQFLQLKESPVFKGDPLEFNPPMTLEDFHLGNKAVEKSHCAQQEMKKLKKNIEELQNQLSSYQKQNVKQAMMIKQLNDQVKTAHQNAQTVKKVYETRVEKIRSQLADLDKRRLNEAAGFRSEIQILRDELQRTQKQLGFLTLRTYETTS